MTRSPIRRLGLHVLAPALALSLAACGVRPVEKSQNEITWESCKMQPLFLDKDVDLLFVIDNSNSMEQEQKNLKANFPKLIEALRTPKLNNKIPNVHIGIVSTDLGAGNYNLPSCETTGGDKGKLLNTPRIAGCTPPKDPWISYDEGTTNIPGGGKDPIKKVKDAFSCIAEIGLNGCGFEQPLESSRRALDPAMNINPGFLRNNPRKNEDALLAIVYITDEDDCSASNSQLFDPSQQGLTDPLGPLTSFRCFEFGVHCDCAGGKKCTRTTMGPRTNCVPGGKYLYKIENYINFFKNLKKTPDGKPNPKRLVMAAIAGDTSRVEVGMDGSNPVLKASCTSAQGEAAPAVRIHALVHAFAQELTTQEISDILDKKRDIPCFVDLGNGKEAQCTAKTKGKGKWKEENFSSICTSDFSPALERLGERIVGALGTLCLDPPALADNGGILCRKGDVIYNDKISGKKVVCQQSCLDQANFTIQEVASTGERADVPKCPSALFDAKKHKRTDCGEYCPCWRIVYSDVCKNQKGSSPYSVEIMRKGEAPKGTYARVCALTSSYAWGTKEFGNLKQCN